MAKKKLTTLDFIERAKKTHGNKYDYSKVEYKDSNTKVCIICQEHGEFYQLPFAHINGQGCKKCGIINRAEKRTLKTEQFIEKAKKVHGDKYDYSKVEYKNAKTPVTIICKKHGEFNQLPNYHLSGNGCQKCGIENVWYKRGRLTTEQFIEKAKKVHGDKYDYSKVEYVNERTPITIICHKKNRKGTEHGEFIQLPSNHLNGQGCKRCRNSHLETLIRMFLIEKNILFEQEKTFEWLKNEKGWPLYLDFYLPEYNVAIECQGVQHFIPLKGNIKKYEEVKKNDEIKKKKCIENNIKLLYFSNKCICEKYAIGEYIFYNKDKLLNEIKK